MPTKTYAICLLFNLCDIPSFNLIKTHLDDVRKLVNKDCKIYLIGTFCDKV